jgi:hypothetical protein
MRFLKMTVQHLTSLRESILRVHNNGRDSNVCVNERKSMRRNRSRNGFIVRVSCVDTQTSYFVFFH